jgi:hypothetical protein
VRLELRPRRAPDARTSEKSRGRIEIRELWVVEAGELSAYLAQIAWVRRWCQRRPSALWTVEQVTVVTSRSQGTLPAHRLLALVRDHWSIENKVHWPRDMTLQEDRLHGREIGVALAGLRNITLNLIRHHLPNLYLPDAHSVLSADLHQAVRWLHQPLRN